MGFSLHMITFEIEHGVCGPNHGGPVNLISSNRYVCLSMKNTSKLLGKELYTEHQGK